MSCRGAHGEASRGRLRFPETASQFCRAAAPLENWLWGAVCFGQMYYTETVVGQCQGSGGDGAERALSTFNREKRFSFWVASVPLAASNCGWSSGHQYGAECGGNSRHLIVSWSRGWCALGKLNRGQEEQDFGLLCLSHLG